MAMGGGGAASDDESTSVAGIAVARRKVSDLDKDALRGLADSLKAKIKSGVVVLANESDGKVQIVVAVTAGPDGACQSGPNREGDCADGRRRRRRAARLSPKPAENSPKTSMQMLTAAPAVIQKLLG